jgi:hypothetical protein
MRLLQRFLILSLAVLTAANVHGQSSTINGPSLGFTAAIGGTAIEPILGIAGASTLGNPLPLDAGIYGTVIAPSQDYAIAFRAGDSQVVVIDLVSGQVTPVAAVTSNLIMVTSPSGNAAAVYDAGRASIQIIRTPRQSPQVAQQFDTSNIPGGASSIAVSDDGSVVLARFVDSGTAGLWMMNSSGAVQRLPMDQPSAAAFFANRNDAIVGSAATQSATIIMNAGQTATQVPLVSTIDGMAGFSSIAASDDGGRVFLGDATSGNIAVVDVQTGQSIVVPCGCQPTGFYHLKGNSIFGLNAPSQEPIRVLDASSTVPRIVFIPPNISVVMGGAQ